MKWHSSCLSSLGLHGCEVLTFAVFKVLMTSRRTAPKTKNLMDSTEEKRQIIFRFYSGRLAIHVFLCLQSDLESESVLLLLLLRPQTLTSFDPTDKWAPPGPGESYWDVSEPTSLMNSEACFKTSWMLFPDGTPAPITHEPFWEGTSSTCSPSPTAVHIISGTAQANASGSADAPRVDSAVQPQHAAVASWLLLTHCLQWVK